MDTLLILLLVATFGVIAYLLGQLPKDKSDMVGVAISLPAMIYFLILAIIQSGDENWGAWLFFILALGIFLKSIRGIYQSRRKEKNLDSPK